MEKANSTIEDYLQTVRQLFGYLLYENPKADKKILQKNIDYAPKIITIENQSVLINMDIYPDKKFLSRYFEDRFEETCKALVAKFGEHIPGVRNFLKISETVPVDLIINYKNRVYKEVV